MPTYGTLMRCVVMHVRVNVVVSCLPAVSTARWRARGVPRGATEVSLFFIFVGSDVSSVEVKDTACNTDWEEERELGNSAAIVRRRKRPRNSSSWGCC